MRSEVLHEPQTGAPDGALAMRAQRYARTHGYTGPIDGQLNAANVPGLPARGGPVNGVLGPASYRGFARFLNSA